MKKNRRIVSLLLAAVLGTSGCTSLPGSHAPAPAADLPRAFEAAAQPGVSSDPVPVRWWRLFDDPALDRHVERALAANTDLRVALAQLEMARGEQRRIGAAQWPAAIVESNLGSDPNGKQPSTSIVPKTSYGLGVAVTYEVDLFGRLRDTAAAAMADSAAQKAVADGVKVTVVADIIAAYIDVCGATEQIALVREQIEALLRSRDLVSEQLRHGDASPLELAQSNAALERVQASLPAYEASLQSARNRLTVLQGQAPTASAARAINCTALPTISSPLPVGDGAALLARRPDIREAERRVAAATSRIGIATAELYPKISFGASTGLLGGAIDIFATPLVSWVFLNREAIHAKVAIARSGEQAALAQWDGTVLRALQEVETVLSDYSAEVRRRDALEKAQAESVLALARARARHQAGADPYLSVLDSERTLNDTAQLLTGSRIRLAQLQVSLFRSLGGGWEATDSSIASFRGKY
ncbi:efflux transporter outer membrane subunit [Paraburkholderia sp. MMS20-SJTR3]|uniref:Efflux transporter outer membrane subunit n=1 Tax=Paraburkholderia sejongensis TaxID=2886946 RepID=A0ABS8JSF6_9BURK|nr:efflux transporter outer membrane subunit [Paraburkholderia sp. MMS20-SJTR3]MCC8392840.1 efflux transporter outer membrane subunit [Paraburkholderia sp. MMS20-SJTR3]